MTAAKIQTAFHKGELAPALFARVDLAAYHTGLATCRNFFVDYRGGVSTRAGTEYILQAFKSATAVRLIPFQASFTVNYVLEFGDFYIRFYFNGGPVLESTKPITGATQANPCVLTVNGHGYNTGDWVFITGVGGMTQLNGKYFQVTNLTANTISLQDLNGNNINSTGYSIYTAGGTIARVYTLVSPYAAADLATLKYAQNVNTLVLCHSSYAPYVLTLISATNWTILPITFGSTIGAPTGVASTSTFAAGAVNYSYEVTAVDFSGQESIASSATSQSAKADEATVRGTNQITWTAVAGAQYYNVYKAKSSITTAIPPGAAYGFIGFTTGVAFNDININPDFSSTPPIGQNPFVGSQVTSITVTASGTYTNVPSVTIAAPANGGQATGSAYLGVLSATPGTSSTNWVVGFQLSFGNGVILRVASVNVNNQITSYTVMNPGFLGNGSTPANPVSAVGLLPGFSASANLTWGVTGVNIIQGGSGYTSVPAVTFSSGTATAIAALGNVAAGYPSVPAYFQQRLVLAGPSGSPQQFNMSIPGSYYNFNISNPIQDDDAIEATINSLQLNTIKALVPMPTGLVTLCDKQAFVINGGGANVPITPADATAAAQAYNGCSDVPPIVSNYDILYVQSKGAIVRDLAYNFYANVYTGTDISILSSHLFFGFTITSWAYAEEPFKLIWVVRSDGALLSLSFLKEQELIGWARHDTSGLFKSNCTVVEAVSQGNVDAHYLVVQRTVNGNTIQYIERMADRFWSGVTDPWCVDAGLNYTGAPATTFTGLDHLEGMTVTGIADGVSFGTKTVTNGAITLSSPASNVTVGLAFTPQIQTLPLDTGEPTIQGKPKKISGVTVRCQSTLGINIGSSLTNQIPMKDTIIGNVGRQTNTVLAGLLTGDAWTATDPLWQVPGQYYITQPNPYPATILGVIPEFDVGNTQK